MKHVKMIALLLSMCLLLSACGTTSGQEGSAKTTLTVAVELNPDVCDINYNANATSQMVNGLIYDRLVNTDEAGNIVPGLATEWEWIDDTSLKFVLREGVKFHNGKELTPEDVLFSISLMISAKSAYYGSFDPENSEIIDEHTFILKLKTPFSPALDYLAVPRSGIVCKSDYDEHGNDYMAVHPNGTGKFVFDNWVSGDSVTLKRNEEYWGYADGVTKPAMETIRLRIIADSSVRALELETGGVDVAQSISDTDYERLSKNENVQLSFTKGGNLIWMFINAKNFDHLLDKTVRQALMKALDLEAMGSAAYGSFAEPVLTQYSSANKYYNNLNKVEWDYDPEEAKQMLTDAGWDFEQVIDLRATESGGNGDWLEIVQSYWNDIGVKSEIHLQDKATQNAMFNDGQIQISVASTAVALPDPDQQMQNYTNTKYGMNTPQEMLDMLYECRAELDDTKRTQILNEFQEMALDHMSKLYVAHVQECYGFRSNVQNFNVNVLNPDLSTITFAN